MTEPSPDVLAAAAEAYTADGLTAFVARWHSAAPIARARMEAGVLQEWSGEPADPDVLHRAAATDGAARARAIYRQTTGHRDEETP